MKNHARECLCLCRFALLLIFIFIFQFQKWRCHISIHPLVLYKKRRYNSAIYIYNNPVTFLPSLPHCSFPLCPVLSSGLFLVRFCYHAPQLVVIGIAASCDSAPCKLIFSCSRFLELHQVICANYSLRSCFQHRCLLSLCYHKFAIPFVFNDAHTGHANAVPPRIPWSRPLLYCVQQTNFDRWFVLRTSSYCASRRRHWCCFDRERTFQCGGCLLLWLSLISGSYNSRQ